MGRPTRTTFSELHITRHSLTKTKQGLKTLDENYFRNRTERIEKIAKLEARIAELEAEEAK